MQDLSDTPLLKTSLATDSMHAGNQIWESNSMKAPGGESGDLPPPGQAHSAVHPAPVIDMISPPVPVGTPKSRTDSGYTPSPLTWKETVNG